MTVDVKHILCDVLNILDGHVLSIEHFIRRVSVLVKKKNLHNRNHTIFHINDKMEQQKLEINLIEMPIGKFKFANFYEIICELIDLWFFSWPNQLCWLYECVLLTLWLWMGFTKLFHANSSDTAISKQKIVFITIVGMLFLSEKKNGLHLNFTI